MTEHCYYDHPENDRGMFWCYDNKSRICPSCCLKCQKNHPSDYKECEAEGQTCQPVPRKLVCLETYWDDHDDARLFGNSSVQRFFNAFGEQLTPPLKLAHRFTDSLAQLNAYVSQPNGILWKDEEIFDTPVYYLSFHGSPGTLIAARNSFPSETLYKFFADWGREYTNLVYFGACRVFDGSTGEEFATKFLKATGCRAILGYTTNVDWFDSMLVDLLFLSRFFNHRSPWKNLRAIYESVLKDMPLAKDMGYTLRER